jgi:hypothetical protein
MAMGLTAPEAIGRRHGEPLQQSGAHEATFAIVRAADRIAF